MDVLYLQLTKYKQSVQHGANIGLSIDESPSQDAREATSGVLPFMGTDVPSIQVQSVAMHPEQEKVIMFRTVRKRCAQEYVIVVITVKPAQDDTHPSTAISFEISLVKRTSDLIIEPTGGHITLMVLSPALLRIAKANEDTQCRARLGNGERCLLHEVHNMWCHAHEDCRQFLIAELNNQELRLENLMKSPDISGNINALNDAYNCTQASLALHIIDSEIFNSVYKDDQLLPLPDVAKKDRTIVAQKLSSLGSDGSGRMSISSMIDGFLDQLKLRETRPMSHVGCLTYVVVNIVDAHLTRWCGITDKTQGPMSSVSEFFGARESSAMRDHLLEEAKRYGDLPDLPIADVDVPTLVTEEE